MSAVQKLGRRRQLDSAEQGNSDRRAATRYRLSLPISIHVPQEAKSFEGVSQNISIRGVYFITDQEIALGSSLDLSFTLPVENAEGTEVFVRAQGRAVRVGKEAGVGQLGVAMVIETYEIVSTSSSRS